MYKKIISLIAALALFNTLNTTPISVSIIIPCIWKHAHYLYPLLKLYERQTALPDEVIISLSQANQVDPAIIAQIQKEPWLFAVRLLPSNEKQYAGINRNIACQEALGTVFLLQDADDIPHPQRVEVIKNIFETEKVDHLMHFFAFTQECNAFKIINAQHAPFVYRTKFYEPITIPYRIHNGNIAIRDYVFSHIKWPDNPRGQDMLFGKLVYKKFKNTIVVKEALCIYRQELSSLNNDSPQEKNEYWQGLYNDFYEEYSKMNNNFSPHTIL